MLYNGLLSLYAQPLAVQCFHVSADLHECKPSACRNDAYVDSQLCLQRQEQHQLRSVMS